MRINTKTVFDIATGEVVIHEFENYEGPLSLAGGGGSSGGSSSGPAVYTKRLPEEQNSFDIWSGLSDQMLSDMGYQIQRTDAMAGLDPKDKEDKQLIKDIKAGKVSKNTISLSRRALTPEEQAQQDWEKRINDQSNTSLEQALNGDIPESLRNNIQTIYDERSRQGQERLKQFGIEMAGSRGLNLSDTPIAQPLLHEYANFQSQLGAAQAGDLITERRKEIAQAQAFREFQANLTQQRKFTNPMNFMSQATNLGLGLYQPRFRGGVGGQQQVGGGTASGIGSVLGGLGGLVGGSSGSGGSGIMGALNSMNVFGNTPMAIPGADGFY
jgi:hypothetical protein